MQLLTRRRGLPPPAGGRPVDHAQHRSDRELAADLEPRVELVPCPAVHPNLAPLAAFPSSDEHRATATVKIALLESERFADPQPRAPQQDDQDAKPVTVGTVPDRAHDGNDLLNLRRICRVLLALVARRAASVIAGQRRRRPAMPSGVQQHGFHESSL
jgi:hypothetical protein